LFLFGRRTGIQGDDFIRCEEKDAMGGCFEIIEESYLGNGESLGEGSSLDDPRKIRGAAPVVDDRARYAEACGRDSNRFGAVLNGACLGVWSRAI